MGIDRQLLWYRYSESDTSESGGERHSWNLLIINDGIHIRSIRQKIYAQLNPILEDKVIDEGEIKDSDLFYRLSCVKATKSFLDFNEVYRGKTQWDRRLQPRRSVNGWNDFIDKIYHGQI